MTVQFSTAVRNAMLDAHETVIGASAILEVRSGAQPANCAAGASGTILATINLPSDWAADASGGSKVKSGTFQDLSADNTGTAAHYRLWDSTKTVCHEQGSVTATGGGGDMTVDNTSFVSGQAFTVTQFTLNAGNA